MFDYWAGAPHGVKISPQLSRCLVLTTEAHVAHAK